MHQSIYTQDPTNQQVLVKVQVTSNLTTGPTTMCRLGSERYIKLLCVEKVLEEKSPIFIENRFSQNQHANKKFSIKNARKCTEKIKFKKINTIH